MSATVSPFQTVKVLTKQPEVKTSTGSRHPEQMNKAAFNGLAGEIVRMIEPHTEADSAALLIQLLVAFGNIIGRNSYIVAENTRHYLNLFCALVGVSSKGRKGTSWNQIANILERIAEVWRKNRVADGMSTGEGLIWNVRDPISETKPIKSSGRNTGEYEQVTTDAGIDDKRLFLIEGEFARTLKCMERDGNTLSAVLRSAWDGGKLQSLTKSSAAQSTGAHVSIVGHITKDELKRLLNQTESANGFANRFLWVAVKRSKCLPEGGAIETVDFSGVEARLKSAIEFARGAGEVRRSEAARALWHSVYPELSEGKQGMLGAVTGRAEAQVMRLSAIYALLDNSFLIQSEHHHAAMAVWGYCERSAQWIFGTSTGDKNSDRILSALQESGIDGLTKTEISEQVFKKNLQANLLSDALRILHDAGLARFETERTGGAPSERWFLSSGVTN